MVEQVHDHLLDELRTNTKTDTVFVLAAILLNLIALAVNSIVASESDRSADTYWVIGLFALLVIAVNTVATAGLLKGRQTRTKLLSGLIRMYEDNGVAGYYDTTLLESYKTRYVLFIVTILITGVLALAIPLILL
jgi:hypothetical protein